MMTQDGDRGGAFKMNGCATGDRRPATGAGQRDVDDDDDGFGGVGREIIIYIHCVGGEDPAEKDRHRVHGEWERG